MTDAPAEGSTWATRILAAQPLYPDDPRELGGYRMVSRLGTGGMGQVFLARRPSGRVVAPAAAGPGSVDAGQFAAVKVVHPQYASDPLFRARFDREVTTARQVRGRWFAELLDAEPDALVPWLATEYVPGPPLERVVAEGGPLPERSIGVLAVRLFEALARLHELGVVHRDVKPSNVLLAADGPKLIDFGIARAVDASAITQTGVVLGAPGFLSPEQALGSEVGAASDVFSVAAVLVYAALGRGPFGSTTTPVAMLRRVVDAQPELDELPEWLLELVAPCLAKDPETRPQAAALVPPGVSDEQLAVGWPPPMNTVALPALPPPPTWGDRLLTRRNLLVGVGVVGAGGLAVGVGELLSGLGAAPRPKLLARPVQRWTVDIGERCTGLASAGGAVFVVSEHGTVSALDPADGRQRWSFALGGNAQRSIGLAPGVVCASDGYKVYALDAVSGRLRWSQPAMTLLGAGAEVIVALVYQLSGTVLTGFDPASGAPRWSYPVQQQSYTLGSPVEVADGRVHVGLQSEIVTLDAASGAEQWRQPWPSGLVPALVVSGGSVYPSPTIEVARFDAATGRPIWRHQTPGNGLYTYLAVAGSTLYLSGSELQALHAETGDIQWTAASSGQIAELGVGAPAISGQGCYLVESYATMDNSKSVTHLQLTVRSIETGQIRSITPLERLPAVTTDCTPLVIADGTLYFGAYTSPSPPAAGSVHAFALA